MGSSPPSQFSGTALEKIWYLIIPGMPGIDILSAGAMDQAMDPTSPSSNSPNSSSSFSSFEELMNFNIDKQELTNIKNIYELKSKNKEPEFQDKFDPLALSNSSIAADNLKAESIFKSMLDYENATI